eukprot:532938-Prorocentrum_minimum.AAC.1
MKRVSRYVGLYTSDMSQNQGFHSPRYRGIPALAEARKKFVYTVCLSGIPALAEALFLPEGEARELAAEALKGLSQRTLMELIAAGHVDPLVRMLGGGAVRANRCDPPANLSHPLWP